LDKCGDVTFVHRLGNAGRVSPWKMGSVFDNGAQEVRLSVDVDFTHPSRWDAGGDTV
jgi:hypothetical protein